MKWWQGAVAVVAAGFGASPAAGQDSAQALPVPGMEFEISVLTAGAGAEVWERFGHNMIRVRNRATGGDQAYNWGMFSFAQPGFVRRFLMGRMHYWMAPQSFSRTVQTYQIQDRTLIEQHLDLPAAARVRLVAFLEWNAREENRFYRYDYYLDNCSTRLRDALDRTVGGAIRAATDTVGTGRTFRGETRRLTDTDLPLYTGLMLGLGPATDRPISAWEEMFLPVRMMERIRHLTIPGVDGTPVPLVASEDTLYLSARFTEPVASGRKVPLYLSLGLALGTLLVLVAVHGGPRAFLVLGALIALLVGLGGALLTFLMGFTDHSVTYGNQNALLLSFLALMLAPALRPALAGSQRAVRLATGLAVAVGGLAVVALLLKALPLQAQDTWETLALFVPIDLGLALGTILATSGPSWRPPKG